VGASQACKVLEAVLVTDTVVRDPRLVSINSQQYWSARRGMLGWQSHHDH
jgi:hypothetical protein